MTKGNVILVGSSWIMREGLKQTLKRLGLAVVGEGDRFEGAWTVSQSGTPPDLVLVVVGQALGFAAALEDQRMAGLMLPEAKRVLLADTEAGADVAAALRAGIDALLSPGLSSRMLGHSLELVFHHQKLFPWHVLPEAGTAAELGPTAPSGDAATRPAVPGHGGTQARGAAHALAKPALVATDRPTSQVIHLEHRLDGRNMVRHAAALAVTWAGPGPKAPDALRPIQPSEREWQILRCLALGGSNKTIARELGIAETTVKVHIKSLLRKLGAANRTQAAVWALTHAEGGDEPQARPAQSTPGN